MENYNSREFKKSVLSHESQVDIDELWNAVQSRKRRKRSAIWYLFVGAIPIITIVVLFHKQIDTKDSLSHKDSTSEYSDIYNFKSTECFQEDLVSKDKGISNFELIKSGLSEIHLTSSDTTSGRNLNEPNLSITKSSHSANNNTQVNESSSQKINSSYSKEIRIPKKNTNSLNKRFIRTFTEYKKSVLINFLPLIPFQKFVRDSIKSFAPVAFIRPNKWDKTYWKHHLELSFALGSYSKTIENNEQREINAALTESPFLTLSLEMAYKRKMTANFHILGGISYSNLKERFIYKYEEELIEPVNSVTEVIYSENGIEEKIEPVLVNNRYIYSKDLLNDFTRYDGFIGFGYTIHTDSRFRIHTEIEYIHPISGSFSGFFLDENSKVIDTRKLEGNILDVLPNRLGLSIGVEYNCLNNFFIGLHGTLEQDLKSINFNFSQKYRTMSAGFSIGYKLDR